MNFEEYYEDRDRQLDNALLNRSQWGQRRDESVLYKITFPSGSTVHYTKTGVLTGILDYTNIHKQSTKKGNTMNTHTITLESFIKDNTPEGMEYDKENSTLDNIVYKSKVKSRTKSTRWEDLGRIEGWYSDAFGHIDNLLSQEPATDVVNTYAALSQCKAHLAQAKLSQIMREFNGDWAADWGDVNQDKYCLILSDTGYDMCIAWGHPKFLAFKSQELAEQVLRENKDLLEQYKPLAG